MIARRAGRRPVGVTEINAACLHEAGGLTLVET